jgi:hypothetical protein
VKVKPTPGVNEYSWLLYMSGNPFTGYKFPWIGLDEYKETFIGYERVTVLTCGVPAITRLADTGWCCRRFQLWKSIPDHLRRKARVGKESYR